MKNKVEARFSSCPYSCVCERNNTADVNSVGCGQQATYIVEIQFPLDNSKIHKKIVVLLTISFVTLVAWNVSQIPQVLCNLFFFHKSGAVDASSLPCCTLLLGRGVSKFHFWVTNPLVFRPTAWVRSERVLPLLASTQAGLEISGKAFVVGLALVFVLHVASFLRLVNYPLG